MDENGPIRHEAQWKVSIDTRLEFLTGKLKTRSDITLYVFAKFYLKSNDTEWKIKSIHTNYYMQSTELCLFYYID
jgi:hypothetical protein